MPLYEYHCSNCGSEFEKMVRFSETGQNQACPVCQSQDTRKKISSVTVFGGSKSASASASSCGTRGGFS